MTKEELLATPIPLEAALRCMLPPYGASIVMASYDKSCRTYSLNGKKGADYYAVLGMMIAAEKLFISEKDFWMFDPTPQVGDLLQWENAYGKKVTGIKIRSSDHSHTVELGHSEDNIPNTSLSLDEYGLRIIQRPHKDTGVMLPHFDPWEG